MKMAMQGTGNGTAMWLAGMALMASVVAVADTKPKAPPAGTEWPTRDNDAGGQRFSPLTQVNPKNVATLATAWTYDTGAPNIQVTPLVIGGVMYIGTGRNIAALEPETGKEIWKYVAPAQVSRRGVAYLSLIHI